MEEKITAPGGEALRVGWAMTGSYCTFADVFSAMENYKNSTNIDILPIMSPAAACETTRFGTADYHRSRMRAISGKDAIITTIAQAEPIGPKKLIDLLIVAPCTSNTLAKLACGICDTAVTMAVKSHLRGGKPVLLAIATNDALAASAKNIGELLARRNIYFVPFSQDDPAGKPRSCIARFELMPEAAAAALRGEQLSPILRG